MYVRARARYIINFIHKFYALTKLISVCIFSPRSHPVVYHGVCLSCARTIAKGYGLSFNFLVEGLKLN